MLFVQVLIIVVYMWCNMQQNRFILGECGTPDEIWIHEDKQLYYVLIVLNILWQCLTIFYCCWCNKVRSYKIHACTTILLCLGRWVLLTPAGLNGQNLTNFFLRLLVKVTHCCELQAKGNAFGTCICCRVQESGLFRILTHRPLWGCDWWPHF